MGPEVYLLELCNTIMRVHLRGRQGCMPQKFFNGIHICPLIQHVRGEGMTEYVRTFLHLLRNPAQVLIYNSINKGFVYFIA